MLFVMIPKDRTCAHAIAAIQEMEKHVRVSETDDDDDELYSCFDVFS